MILVKDVDRAVLPPCTATIGFFDGVHVGHRFLLGRVIEEARNAGTASMAITFGRHPREVTDSGYVPKLLTTPRRKIELIETTGIDYTVLLPFDKDMASLSAHDFMAKVLSSRLNVRRLVIGYDNRFGHNREEGFDEYVRYGRELGIEVLHSPAFVLDGNRVSSSLVRRLLADGQVEKASKCLGRYYSISGNIVSGYHIGRRMGFPTANLQPEDSRLLLPADGVYAVKVDVEGFFTGRKAMTNVGMRPTFGGQYTTIETFIPDFSGDLYNRSMTVYFCRRIRGEHRFDNVDELEAQLEKDKEQIEMMDY